MRGKRAVRGTETVAALRSHKNDWGAGFVRGLLKTIPFPDIRGYLVEIGAHTL